MAATYTRARNAPERPSRIVYFLVKVYSIAANTLVESIRQPVFAVIIGSACALILISPYITMFTLMESHKMMTDMGMATIMLAGLLLAAFTASKVVSDEIENKTVLTVVSKPVGRTEFILGKFVGVMLGLTVAVYLLSLTLVVTLSGGAMEAQLEQEISIWIVLSILAAMLVSVGYGVYCNFFNDQPFPSRTIGLAIPLFSIVAVVFSFINPREFEYVKGTQSLWGKMLATGSSFDPQVISGCFLLLWSILILAALSVAISTRLAVVVNVVICSLVFILGLLSDFLFGAWAKKGIEAGAAMEGFFVVGAIVLFGVAVLVGAFRYLSGYIKVGLCVALLVAGAVIALLKMSVPLSVLRGIPRFVFLRVHNVPAALLGGVAVGLCVVALAVGLILFLKQSRRLAGVLRMATYLGVFGFGVHGTGYVAYWTRGLDMSGAKIVSAKTIYAILPNLQVFWIAHLLAAGRRVNWYYVLSSGVYAFFFVVAFLILAMMLFRERQLA